MSPSLDAIARRSRAAYRQQLEGFGPFTIPTKDSWLIVGSGPSSENVQDFIDSHPECGVMAINMTLNHLSHADINIQNHYEGYVLTEKSHSRCDIMYLAEPMHVGFRGVPISVQNLLWFDALICEYPQDVRFFKKEANIQRWEDDSNSLFSNCTASTVALSLLVRNFFEGTVYTAGIDGGTGRSKLMAPTYDYCKDNGNYDGGLEDFVTFAKKYNLNIKRSA